MCDKPECSTVDVLHTLRYLGAHPGLGVSFIKQRRVYSQRTDTQLTHTHGNIKLCSCDWDDAGQVMASQI